MQSAEERAKGERAIFRVFANACALPVRMRSIRSRPVPEPDIRCTLDGHGTVAFELGEVVAKPFAETTYQRPTLRRRFRDAYATLPESVRSCVQARLGGQPAVFVAYRKGTSPGKWHHAVSPILKALSERASQLSPGEIPVWQIPGLKDILTDMTVRPTSGPHATLHEMGLTEVSDATIALLGKKFRKSYQCDVPIELVGYYASQPPGRTLRWSAVASFVHDNLGASQFRRVWLFDNFSQTVPFVHPPLL
jgi:hypothetical protein